MHAYLISKLLINIKKYLLIFLNILNEALHAACHFSVIVVLEKKFLSRYFWGFLNETFEGEIVEGFFYNLGTKFNDGTRSRLSTEFSQTKAIPCQIDWLKYRPNT